MRLTRIGKPDNFYYYVIEDYKNDKGQKKTRTVESLGCARVIREKFGVDDAEQWCREYIAKKNNEIKEFKENNCREIEECFRIMKSDLVARPFFHNKDSRIIAHFQTCFMALLLLRGIEYKLSEYHGSKDKYPNGRYTMDQILNALKSMNVFSVENGLAYMPDYNNSQLIEDLLTIFSMKEFTKQIVMKDKMKKIIQSIKKSPVVYKKG